MEPSATVAVLFCDVVGSTARQVRLGDVRADDHRRRLFALLEGAVSTSDGLVVKTLGDGLMAVFQRSTVSALECAATMHSIAQGFDPEDPLELRVGVSVGEVLEEDGDWFGTPVVEAARLCDAAGDGRTLAHALVASLVGSRATGFSFVERGERTLKGLSEPTPVVTVMASEDHGIVRSGPESVSSEPQPVTGTQPETSGAPPGARPPPRRPRRRVLVGAGVGLAVLGAVVLWATSTDGGTEDGSKDSGDGGGSGPTLEYEPVVSSADCAPDLVQNLPTVTCGHLEVPENRDNPDGPIIQLPFAMVPAETPTAAAPVIIVDFGEHLNRSELREVADVYALSVRGYDDVGSERLKCPELAEEWTKSLAVPPDDQAAIDGLAAASGACSKRLRSEGVDLEGYNWREVAADVRDLALAEDLGSVTVAAGSYLTLPAVSFARSNPDMANALLLTNPIPPGQSAVAETTRTTSLAVAHLNDLCRSEPRCSSRFGDLTPLVHERVERADRELRTMSVESLDGDGPFDVLLDGLRVGGALETSIRATEQLGLVPWSLGGASDELLASVSIHDVATAYIRPEARAGAHLSFSCSYEAQPVTVAEVYSGDNSDFAGAQDFALPDMCHAWGVKPRILEFSDPLVGDVPVLVAEGALSESGVNDWGDEVVELIENPLVVRFDTMSSDLAYDPPPCLRELRKEFAIDPGSVTGAANCETETPEIDWVLG